MMKMLKLLPRSAVSSTRGQPPQRLLWQGQHRWATTTTRNGSRGRPVLWKALGTTTSKTGADATSTTKSHQTTIKSHSVLSSGTPAAHSLGWTPASLVRRLAEQEQQCRRRRLTPTSRFFSTTSDGENDEDIASMPRESMEYDVLVVGGGPAGLAAAIKLKQEKEDLNVCLIDKGSDIGAHILSGNVFDPRALHELFPDLADVDPATGQPRWVEEFHDAVGSHATPVTKDQFLVLSENSAWEVPHAFMPPQLDNTGNFVISLLQLCRWLAQRAEDLGVEIYPGFAASEVLIDPDTNLCYGVATRDVGLDRQHRPKPTFERGVELHARYTLLAEGARGSCSEFLMDHYQLRTPDATTQRSILPQTYGLGLKEVWQVPEDQIQPGLVQHTLGFPLQSSFTDKTFGGSFLYHQAPDLILVGVVVGLDYANPYLNPYHAFQRFKTHPQIRPQFENGTCLSYGARVLNEGGYHALPSQLVFPGGALLGCGAGFLNPVQIKGSHAALQSGILAAQAIVEQQNSSDADADKNILTGYQDRVDESWITKELYEVRNCHAAFAQWGVGAGLAYTGLTTHLFRGREPWTLSGHGHGGDSESTQPASAADAASQPAFQPDGKVTFDLLTNLQRSGTYHAEDQPIHLRIKPGMDDVPTKVSYPQYAGPEQRFCPAAVYEYVEDHGDDAAAASSEETTISASDSDKKNMKLVINSQNCLHCKSCSIKMPGEYIEWTVPEGGGGPQYQLM